MLLAYRDWDLRMHLATADAWDGEYTVAARNIFGEGRLEDPDLHFAGGLYHMVMEDNEGRLTGHVRHGGHLVSGDGLAWRRAQDAHVYTHDIVYDDGTRLTAERRERPELFNARADVKGRGDPTHLATGVLYRGETWNVVQPVAPD